MLSFEGLIATPFGYLLDGLYQLTGSYGFALMIFAVIAQTLVTSLQIAKRPIDSRIASTKAKLAIIRPAEAALQKEYEGKLMSDEYAEKAAALYNDAGIKQSVHYLLVMVSTFITWVLPVLILIPIFQAVAQPITYMFHETPETAAAIVKAIWEEAPELFVSGYNQVTAITHIQDFAEIVKEKIPEVSARTLQGLDYSFLGLNLGSVPGVHVLGKADWAWDWAHIGVVLIPIVYMARRIYTAVAGIYRTFSSYAKEKKKAKANNEPLPKLPNPPLLTIFFLLLSLTALFSVPIAMNLYWLTGGVASAALHKLISKRMTKRVIVSKEIGADIKIEQVL